MACKDLANFRKKIASLSPKISAVKKKSIIFVLQLNRIFAQTNSFIKELLALPGLEHSWLTQKLPNKRAQFRFLYSKTRRLQRIREEITFLEESFRYELLLNCENVQTDLTKYSRKNL